MDLLPIYSNVGVNRIRFMLFESKERQETEMVACYPIDTFSQPLIFEIARTNNMVERKVSMEEWDGREMRASYMTWTTIT